MGESLSLGRNAFISPSVSPVPIYRTSSFAQLYSRFEKESPLGPDRLERPNNDLAPVFQDTDYSQCEACSI